MITWVVWAWLCTGPGPSGECHALPDWPVATLSECYHEAADLRATLGDRVIAHCRKARGD